MIDTHTARAVQYQGPEKQPTGEPGESDFVRFGMEAGQDADPPTMTKAERKRMKGAKPGMFNTKKFRCWMTGNGSSI